MLEAGGWKSVTNLQPPTSSFQITFQSVRPPDCPLRPTAVVVPHVWVAQQIPEHEPGVARSFADAAVGDDAVAGIETLLLLVELAQLRCGLERAVLRIGAFAQGTLAAPLM